VIVSSSFRSVIRRQSSMSEPRMFSPLSLLRSAGPVPSDESISPHFFAAANAVTFVSALQIISSLGAPLIKRPNSSDQQSKSRRPRQPRKSMLFGSERISNTSRKISGLGFVIARGRDWPCRSEVEKVSSLDEQLGW